MKKKTEMRFCPRCKATNVKKDITASAVLGAPQEWMCNECHFRGHLFPVMEIEKEKDDRAA